MIFSAANEPTTKLTWNGIYNLFYFHNVTRLNYIYWENFIYCIVKSEWHVPEWERR